MQTIKLLAVLFILVLPVAGLAQSSSPQEISGARFNGTASGADSDAVFAIGLSLDNGNTFTDSARITESVRIIGTVSPEPEHVGQQADIFVVDRVNLAFTMKNPDGNFVSWDTKVPNLAPFLESVTLTEALQVDVFTGTLGAAGDHRLFLGYLPEDGILRYTPVPLRIDITEQTPTEEAFELFQANISAPILGTRCSQCHIPGGEADIGGARHIFQLPLASNLETNFSIFSNLVAAESVDYILTKVRGGNFHGGGVQLTQGSQAYVDLEEFLDRVQLGIDQGTTGSVSSVQQSDDQSSEDEYMTEDPYEDTYYSSS